MSDLVGNPKDRFSHDEAHFLFLRIFLMISKGKGKTRIVFLQKNRCLPLLGIKKKSKHHLIKLLTEIMLIF